MRRLFLASSLLATLALALSGCGKDANTTTPAATVTATVTETSSPSPSTDVATPTPRSSGFSVDLTRPPATYDAAMEHFRAAFQLNDIPRDLNRFVSPSGNIYCSLGAGGIPPSCELTEGQIRDPGVCAGGATTFVGRMEFDQGRAIAVCNTDTIRTPNPPTLGYGQVARRTGGTVQCLVERIGVTCVNTAATEGFFLRKGDYLIFNAG